MNERDNWATPVSVFAQLCEAAKFVPILDVCASEQNSKCPNYFDAEMNGLKQHWDHPWFCNPPYTDIGPWVKKAITAPESGILLLPGNRTGRSWWADLIKDQPVLVFFEGRIKFIAPHGIQESSPRFDNVAAIIRPSWNLGGIMSLKVDNG